MYFDFFCLTHENILKNVGLVLFICLYVLLGILIKMKNYNLF